MASAPERFRSAAGAKVAAGDFCAAPADEAVLLVDTRALRNSILLANGTALQFFGGDAEAMSRTAIHERLAATDAAVFDAALGELDRSRGSLTCFLSWRAASGVARVETRLQRLEGVATPGMVMLQFPTRATPPAKALPSNATEQRLRALTRHAYDVIAVAGPGGEVLFVSGGVANTLGYNPEERRAQNIFDKIHEDDMPALRAQFERMLHGELEYFVWHCRIRHNDGSYRWFESTYVRTLDDPLIGGIVIHSRDVTDVQRLAGLLAETQRATNAGGWEYLCRTRELTLTDQMFAIFGTKRTPAAVTPESALARFTPDSRRRLEAAAARALGGAERFELDLEILTFAEQRLWVRVIGRVERRDGRPLRLYGSLQSVHAEKTSQFALESRTEWLQLSMHMAQTRAWRWDSRSDRVEFAALKRPGAQVLRYEAGLQRLLSRIPASEREAVLEAIARALRDRQEVTQEFRVRTGAAGYRSYVTVARPLLDAQGRSYGLFGVTRDITERRRLEREVIEISSRERHRIGRDLHDGLGQELTGIALMLRGLARRIEAESPGAVRMSDEIVAFVNKSIESVRALARGLLPVTAEHGGLRLALNELAKRGISLYGIEVSCRADQQAQLQFDPNEASHLYRIAQEALNNAARHGRATRVEIVMQVDGRRYQLRIADNGIGIGMPDASLAQTGLGMHIMKYRASLLGAKLEVLANAPRGTVISVVGEQQVVARA